MFDEVGCLTPATITEAWKTLHHHQTPSPTPIFDTHHTDGMFGYVRPLNSKLFLDTPQLCETSLAPYRHECQFEIRVSTRASNISLEGVLCVHKCCAIATAKYCPG